MEDNIYMCSVCGKQGVKLWRTRTKKILVCAECAEKAQVRLRYNEKKWILVSNDGEVGILTGKKLLLRKWKVNKKGMVPSYDGPGPKGKPRRTNELIVDLSKISDVYSSEKISMIPAVQTDDGDYYEIKQIPVDAYKNWEKLPTR
jgi:DNA-directed RNA polymerase subunit RPC12/RpoP